MFKARMKPEMCVWCLECFFAYFANRIDVCDVNNNAFSSARSVLAFASTARAYHRDPETIAREQLLAVRALMAVRALFDLL